MTDDRPHLAVIGAGPAGLAATVAAATHGVRVTLIDSAAQAGGQFYRRPAAELNARRPQALHHQWRTWERLNDALAHHVETGHVTHLTDHHVWLVEREFNDRSGATGRTAFLLPVATGLAAAGVEVAALVESTDPKAFVRRTRALAAQPGKIAEGAQYAAQLLRHRVTLLTRHAVVEAHGDERLEAVTVAALDTDGRVRPGTERRIACDTLAVGHGMLPHTDLAETLGCRLDGTGVHVDDEQRTDVPGVWAAGETTGIGGAALSLAEGHIAGRSAAARLNGTEPDPSSWAPAAKSRRGLREFFAALDTVYAPPAHWADLVTDDTVVCRCEEVTGGAIREAVDGLGAGDVRTVKLLTRAGMGWCQGRMCGPAVAGLAGCAFAPSRRPFARPVPLGVLARAGEARDPGEVQQ
jgi:NADPH-dependent 2,4-dienoyl-CoA reductase/sulfur reductase-like enzyme